MLFQKLVVIARASTRVTNYRVGSAPSRLFMPSECGTTSARVLCSTVSNRSFLGSCLHAKRLGAPSCLAAKILAHKFEFGASAHEIYRRQQTCDTPPSAHSVTSLAIMATELAVQSERAYQKQPHIFLHHKSKAAKSKKVGKAGRRWFKDVGLGFRTPKTAVDGSYIGQSTYREISARAED